MEEIVELISEETLKKRIGEAAKAISEDYQGKDIVMICVLKGAKPFFESLCEEIKGVSITKDYIKVSSYTKTESNREPVIGTNISTDISKKDVIVVEDIIDTGHSLDTLVNNYLAGKGPNSIEVAVMLDKPSRRENHNITPKYTCFTIPNLFVVGKGLDFDEEYRELPFVGVVKSSLERPIDEDIEGIIAQLGTPIRRVIKPLELTKQGKSGIIAKQIKGE